MSKQDDEMRISQERLVNAWKETLPTTIKATDKATVFADEANPQAIRIQIDSSGHSDYSFDFVCTYVDSREVKVELVDVERAGQTTDERSELIQQLVQDHVRDIHECAQALQELTHS